MIRQHLIFDTIDRKLYQEYLEVDRKKNPNSEELLFSSHMHPHGIKEMLEPQQIRVARSILFLLNALEKESVADRLSALHSMRDEVMSCSRSPMIKNTARVLLCIMKDLVRENKTEKELELLHDFNSLVSGKALLVRKYLRKYNLLEMPESWNQISFDYHVHDSYTKGRKTPTHLIMDAWIKGIRRLTVIYYSLPPPTAIRELLTAALYMDIKIRIGIEFTTQFRNKMINIIWVPEKLPDARSYFEFLNKPVVKKFSELTSEVTTARKNHVFSLLQKFNREKLQSFNKFYGISMDCLKKDDLLSYIGDGLPAPIHLAEFICKSAVPLIRKKMAELQPAKNEKTHFFREYCEKADGLSPDFVLSTFFGSPEDFEYTGKQGRPRLMRYDPFSLIGFLDKLTSDSIVTLNLRGLSVADVLELLYDCKGRIANIEIYNYKNYASNQMPDIAKVGKLEQCINEKNIPRLKRLIKKDLMNIPASDIDLSQSQKIESILININKLFTFYRNKKIYETWGSDSTGRSVYLNGMGFALLETLPSSARREVRKNKSRLLPVHIKTLYRETWQNDAFSNSRNPVFALKLHQRKLSREWVAFHTSDSNHKQNNLVALGERVVQKEPYFTDMTETSSRKSFSYYKTYMPTNLKNWVKVLMGFIPAFLSFFLTKDWPVLAYFGAPIWFAITGIRNIIQSVLGGDSFKRSHLLRWTSYIDWSRIADSLLYSGLSVPLLDYLVKTVLLDRCFSLNMTTDPLAVYAVMSLVNGIYISLHNTLRGFPKSVIIGNFFRSILSIPVAFLCSSIVGEVFFSFGAKDIDALLQKLATIISKFASDLVGGIIEGLATYRRNRRLRKQDYDRKLEQFMNTCSKIELAYPQKNVLKQLKQHKNIVGNLGRDNPKLLKVLIYDSLDLLYFWEFQPCARVVLKSEILQMTGRNRSIFLNYQNILRDKTTVSVLITHGILGQNYKKALAFYLSKSDEYLDSIEKLCR